MDLSLKNFRSQMVDVPPGSILLRDDRTEQQWDTIIKPFSLSIVPVTQSFYGDVTGLWPSAGVGKNCPVETVSWIDAMKFCNRLSELEGLTGRYDLDADDESYGVVEDSNGYRLPSEAEWEFACRAGTNTVRYGELNDIAWYKGNSENSIHPVGQKQPNAWGLYDMLGNTWEWCEDIYDPAVYGSYRIFRGGGWSDVERGCLATNRRRSHPTFAIDDLGFRIARTQ